MGQPFAESSCIDEEGNVRSGDGAYDEHGGSTRTVTSGCRPTVRATGRTAATSTPTAGSTRRTARPRTSPRHPGETDPRALAAFQAGITRASLTDAQGNELTWAGGNRWWSSEMAAILRRRLTRIGGYPAVTRHTALRAARWRAGGPLGGVIPARGRSRRDRRPEGSARRP